MARLLQGPVGLLVQEHLSAWVSCRVLSTCGAPPASSHCPPVSQRGLRWCWGAAGGFGEIGVVLALPLVAHFVGWLFRAYFKMWPEMTRPNCRAGGETNPLNAELLADLTAADLTV